MYILECTADTTGDWYRVLFGGDFTIANQASDDLGSGTLTLEFADVDGNLLAMPTAATFTQPIKSQIVTLARGTLVRMTLLGSTDPVCNVLLQSDLIQEPVLKLVTP